MTTLETPRLILRCPERRDLPAIAAQFADPEVVRYIGGGQPLSRPDAWSRLLRDVGHWTLEGFGLFAIVEKKSGAHVGKAGFARFERDLGPASGTDIEGSWMLADRAQGMGYATEAMEAAQRWFDAEFARRTACIIAPENAASIRLADRLGYREAGTTIHGGRTLLVLARDAG